MSVTKVTRDIKTWSGGVDADGTRRYIAKFFVHTNDLDDGPMTAMTAEALPVGAVPREGDRYQMGNDVDYWAFVEKVTPRRNASRPYLWELLVEYKTVVGEPDEPEEEPGEEDDIGDVIRLDDPVLRGGSWTHRKAWTEDLDGRAMANSAGELYDPPIERDVKYPSIYYERNEIAFPGVTAAEYTWAINGAALWGYDPGTILIDEIPWEIKRTQGVWYYRVGYMLLIKPDGWLEDFLDDGFYRLGTPDGGPVSPSTPTDQIVMVRARDPHGVMTNKRVLLDGEGNRLRDGASPVYLENRRFHAVKEFGDLALPNITLLPETPSSSA